MGLVELILQGLEGKIPPVLGDMVANELYLVSFVMQLLGLRWFVGASRYGSAGPLLQSGLPWWPIPFCFSTRSRYSSNFINVPNILVCYVAAWILFKNGRGPFSAVARVTAWSSSRMRW